jgi:inner membrane protein
MIEQAFDWTWAWIIAGAIIAGLEILIPGIFLLWIGLGAVATGVVLARYPDLALEWQLLVFAVSMVSSVGIGFWIQRRSGRTRQARLLNREMKAMIGKTYVAGAAFTVGRVMPAQAGGAPEQAALVHRMYPDLFRTCTLGGPRRQGEPCCARLEPGGPL